MIGVVRLLDEECAARRLISTPMKANGAHPLTAHGIPQMETRKVANRRDRVSGAKTMVSANIMCDIIHAVCKSGRIKATLLSSRMMLRGNRGANDDFLFWGDRTPKGRTTELMKVIREKITRDTLPRRPTSPRISFEFSIADCGTSYRKYVSPTHVLL
jgi:hypothetical protein